MHRNISVYQAYLEYFHVWSKCYAISLFLHISGYIDIEIFLHTIYEYMSVCIQVNMYIYIECIYATYIHTYNATYM